MQLQTSATQVDFFPIGENPKRFVKRTIWHPGFKEITTFCTRVKSDAIYDIEQLIANGAEVTGYNTEEYTGKDYSPMMC